MGLALQKSTDCGATFQQVSVDVANYTLSNGSVANYFLSVKDSQNNTYIMCFLSSGISTDCPIPLIKISNAGVVTKVEIPCDGYDGNANANTALVLSRDESLLYFSLHGNGKSIYSIPTNMGTATKTLVVTAAAGSKFAIYKDLYIWVASGTTVKIYNYDTKAELATVSLSSTAQLLALNDQNIAYSIDNSGQLNSLSYNPPVPPTTTGIITKTNINSGMSNVMKQLLIDRFGDLIILTNTGTSSTLLKYSNTGTLIDTVNLSVGTNKGAYGLQVYSKDNGTKCWVQFSNDLGTWRTEAKSYDATPANRTFGAVSKIRDNGVTTYGDDHGGDNNYSVRC